MVSYPIVEIFHSVQGEAFHTGVPHVFIRFGNCNLRCEWCDTDFLTYEEMELNDIVDKVLAYDCKRVIFTGGEPAMQDLQRIGKELKNHGIHGIRYGLALRTGATGSCTKTARAFMCANKEVLKRQYKSSCAGGCMSEMSKSR